MRLLRIELARLTTAALLCGACSTTPAITVVATPNPLVGDGKTTLTVTASPTEGGGASAGATVHFKTTLGTWDGATGTGDLIDVQSDGTGKAIATMSAPRQGWGTMQITASVSLQGKEPSASVSVPLVPAGGAASSLTFVCQHQNIGGLVHGRLHDLHVLCRATAVDASNHPIANASVQTLSEAGTLTWARDNASVQEFVYTVRPDDPPPKDVSPFDGNGKELDVCPSGCNANPFGAGCATGEPCYTDATGTHNPRDGIATLVAAVPGVKGFDNLGEPFVDLNDNGVRDPGEPFIDYNGNGKYDGPDGSLREHMVWKTFRMIWSGEASVSATGSGTTHDVFMNFTPTGAPSGTLALRLFDRNLNQLAADGPSASDGIVWTAGNCAKGGTLAFVADTQIMDQTHPGIGFNPDTGAISAPGQRSTWTQNTDYSNSVTISAAPDSCGISAAPQRVYDPGAIDLPSGGSNPDAVVTGSVAF